MTAIQSIQVTIKTATVENAGFDGFVFLGIAGREFGCFLDGINNFERGMETTYIFGEGGNTTSPEYNDPRKPALNEADIEAFPVYLRAVPQSNYQSGAWAFRRASVLINDKPNVRYSRRFSVPVWMYWGNLLYLKRIEPPLGPGGINVGPAAPA